MVKWIIMCGSIISCSTVFAQQKTEVLFSSLFTAGRLGTSVIIQTTHAQLLVLDGGEHVLDGRDLIVRAPFAVIKKPTTVRSYSITSNAGETGGVGPSKPQKQGLKPANCDSTAQNEGCSGADGDHGSMGAEGRKGAKSGRMIWKIDSISADGGELILLAQGQKGGKGQTGGTGQQGAHGLEGKGQNGAPGCGGPWRGGFGGDGGPAGAGGPGGKGGTGGDVFLSSVMNDLKTQLFPKLVVNISGGPGGDKGDNGMGGAGGGPGRTGPRNDICPGPNPGPATNGGTGALVPTEVTPDSLTGDKGSVIILK